MHTSFEVLKAFNWVKGVDNNYTPSLVHPSIGKYQFLPQSNARFGTQDYWLAKTQHTVTYVRVLQYWAEQAQLPALGQPQCLAQSVRELWWAMELLAIFTEVKVSAAKAPSDWREVSSPQLMQPISQDSPLSHYCHCSCSCSVQAHPREVPVSRLCQSPTHQYH